MPMTNPKLLVTDFFETLLDKHEQAKAELLALTEHERRNSRDLGITRVDLYRNEDQPSQFLLCRHIAENSDPLWSPPLDLYEAKRLSVKASSEDAAS